MRTNIDIDRANVEMLMKLTGAKTMREAINGAVEDQLRFAKALEDIKTLRGSIEFDDNYDYKAMRRSGGKN